jgi:hypothetical protein
VAVLTRAARFRIALGLLAGAVVLGPAFAGCVGTGASLGQSCLTNEDCFSGYCAMRVCVAAPTFIDAEVEADGATTDDGPPADAPLAADGSDSSPASDAAGDAQPDAAETGSDGAAPDADASTPVDAPGSTDGAGDATSDSTTDGAGAVEAGQDAPADVRLDVGGG